MGRPMSRMSNWICSRFIIMCVCVCLRACVRSNEWHTRQHTHTQYTHNIRTHNNHLKCFAFECLNAHEHVSHTLVLAAIRPGGGVGGRIGGPQAHRLCKRRSLTTHISVRIYFYLIHIYIYMYICLYRTWNLYGFVFGIPELHEIL